MTFGDAVYSGVTSLYNFGYNAATGTLSPNQVASIKAAEVQKVVAAGGTSDDVARTVADINAALDLNGVGPGGGPSNYQLLAFAGLGLVIILAGYNVLKKAVKL